MTTLHKLDQITLSRSDVLMDDEINSRRKVDPDEIKRLAADIKARGAVIHPPMVMRTAQAGERFEDSAEPFLLIVGFRRQKALDELDVTETVYSIAPKDWTLADAMAANLGENMAREDLTSYDLAMACSRMKEEEDLSGEEIAKRIKAHDHDPEGSRPLSGAHVNNLIRCTALPDPILKAWEAEQPAASLRNLLKLAAMETEEEQITAWQVLTGEASADGEGEEGNGKGSKGGKGNARRDRPTGDATALAIEAVKKSDQSDEWKDGAIAALKWAAGIETSIPGVELASKPAKGAKKGKKGAKGKKSAKGAKGGKKSGKANGAGESPAASPA